MGVPQQSHPHNPFGEEYEAMVRAQNASRTVDMLTFDSSLWYMPILEDAKGQLTVSFHELTGPGWTKHLVAPKFVLCFNKEYGESYQYRYKSNKELDLFAADEEVLERLNQSFVMQGMKIKITQEGWKHANPKWIHRKLAK